ncbi:MAG: UDP-N-acetylmuramoyl-tripeptide--D-alanyl-D-alanine ligase [Candidatus Doudnabacteria bacterium]|nr:UDP-N-acetylmuramoyl-tripeptide--D-alanyl-D-alanine ligase [Candidatus Doudnabacteria bacterium]
MKRLLQFILRVLSQLILWKYQPVVIAITGSVGKTSTKEAIFAVAAAKLRTWKSRGNYNNEIGVPLAIIGAESGGKNIWAWLGVLLRAKLLFLLPYPYPKVLVLEMGADRPGDIEYLMSFVHPKISVVTAVGPSHLEYFGKVERIAREKSRIITGLVVGGAAVLNYDDEKVQAMALKHADRIFFYGLDPEADIFASDLAEKTAGTYFKIHYHGNVVPVELPGGLGKPNVYAALAAVAVGLALKMNLVEISRALGAFEPPPGRLRLLAGIKDTKIIDDTYNAAPSSALAALEVLARLGEKRRIAVLGDMLELGESTEGSHRQLGAVVVELKINVLVTVGSRAKFIADEARRLGMPARDILEFATSDEALKPVQRLLRKGDTVLVKGSQGVRMEKIVKEIMAEPEKAGRLLCRQSPDWLDKP